MKGIAVYRKSTLSTWPPTLWHEYYPCAGYWTAKEDELHASVSSALCPLGVLVIILHGAGIATGTQKKGKKGVMVSREH